MRMDLDGALVDHATLIPHLQKITAEKSDLHVAIAADRNLTHGNVVDIIDLLQKNGINKFSINVKQ